MEQQAVTYVLQQGPAVVVCIATACAFGVAVVQLFRECREERKDAAAQLAAANVAAAVALQQAHAEASEERRNWAATLDKHTAAIDANTRATERLTDRLASSPSARAA